VSAPTTFYWHDYETTGADPRRDRPLQFAGVRTDAELEIIGEPSVLYCQPAADVLPSPWATAVTGIGPASARQHGLTEAAFAAAVVELLGAPATCGVGFNSLRFDDEVTRHLLWRNLYDPYAREWRHGNSRWDVIDLFRLARALRPEGMAWPDHESGMPSFRLEDLARANGIDHDAHDALADVMATLALVRRLRAAQPRLYAFAAAHRDRRSAADLLRFDRGEPVLHVGARYGAHRGCIAPVAPVAMHPADRNGVIVVDLSSDPAALLDLSADALAARLFTPAAERADGDPGIPLQVIKLNRAPVLAPLATLDAEAAARLELEPERVRARFSAVRQCSDLAERLRRVFVPPEAAAGDPDVALYEGFVDDDDRARLDQVHRRSPADLAGFDPGLGDARLRALYFRYRARNWPATLCPEDAERWRELRWRRLCAGEAGSPRALADFRRELASARAGAALGEALAGELEQWAGELFADLPACPEASDA